MSLAGIYNVGRLDRVRFVVNIEIPFVSPGFLGVVVLEALGLRLLDFVMSVGTLRINIIAKM